MAIIGSIVVLGLYSFSNYVTDIPQVDFRPFRERANIAERKALEEEAEANVKVLAYKMTNKSTGETVELPFDVYMQEYAKYPAEEWELDQVKSEPTVVRTKISDFEVSDLKGNDITSGILQEEGPSIMIVAYRLYGTERKETKMVPDSIFVVDTVITLLDTVLERRLTKVAQKEVVTTIYDWDPAYLEKWTKEFLPVMDAAAAGGLKVYAVTAYSDPERITSFRKALGTKIPFFMADDILLKTIVRSNPGPVLMKGGVVLKKWHHKNIPSFESITTDFLSGS
jgi:hypothetical protein